jgi:hypothetical protein
MHGGNWGKGGGFLLIGLTDRSVVSPDLNVETVVQNGIDGWLLADRVPC